MHLRRLPTPTFAPDDGAAAGGTPGTGDTAAAPLPGASTDDASLFDAVEQAAAAQGVPQPDAAGKPQRPDNIPEQFWDSEKGEVRLAELGKSWLDLRTKVARGEGKIPDAPDGYALPAMEGMPEDLVPANDPVWTEVRAAAHKAGVTQAQMDALTKPFLAAQMKALAAKQQATDPAAAEAQRRQWAEQEVAKLGPNGQQVVRDVGGWIGGMVARGSLSEGEGRALKALGTAEGVRALAKLREAMGAPPIPTEALDGATMTQADATRMMQDGYRKGDQEMVERARRALEELDRRGHLRVA